MPVSVLSVLHGQEAGLLEVDAPPLFLARRSRLVLPPVLEEEVEARLVRRCRFEVQDGDYLAIVSERFVQPRGKERTWRWSDIALSIQRLTGAGGDAEQLLGALLRMHARLAPAEAAPDVTVIAMHVRQLHKVTLWSGPPADRLLDEAVVRRLMAAPGKRVICGGTTAAIAARVLGAELKLEPRPADGWAEVPGTSRLEGVDLVTEGVVTLRKAVERMAGVQRARELPRREDGATRLARMLLDADVVHLIIGSAVNPAQADGPVPWRRGAIETLITELQTRGKVVSFEYVGHAPSSS